MVFKSNLPSLSAYLATQSGGILQTTVSTVKFQILGQFDRWWAEGMLQLWQTWAGGQIAGENKHCSTAVKLPRNMAPDGTLEVMRLNDNVFTQNPIMWIECIYIIIFCIITKK